MFIIHRHLPLDIFYVDIIFYNNTKNREIFIQPISIQTYQLYLLQITVCCTHVNWRIENDKDSQLYIKIFIAHDNVVSSLICSYSAADWFQKVFSFRV